jgi:hypothetical protein
MAIEAMSKKRFIQELVLAFIGRADNSKATLADVVKHATVVASFVEEQQSQQTVKKSKSASCPVVSSNFVDKGGYNSPPTTQRPTDPPGASKPKQTLKEVIASMTPGSLELSEADMKKMTEDIVESGYKYASGYTDLLDMVRDMVNESTNPAARSFDYALWFEKWVMIENPALGYCKPIDLLSTHAGFNSVKRVLGSMVSGAYQ